MKNQPFFILVLGLAGLFWTSAAPAQDVVYTQTNLDKGIKGKVELESTRGVKTSGAKELIPAEEIFDVVFEVKPLQILLNAYRPAVEADHKGTKAAKEGARKGFIDDALKKYQEALVGMEPDQKFAQRNIEFRIAYLRAVLAREDAKDTGAREVAVLKLTEFKTKYPTSWQLGKALKTLAELQTDIKDYAAAEQTYRELAEADVNDALKESADLLAATLSVRAGKFADAEKNLQGLIARLPKDSRQSLRAQVALGEALAMGAGIDLDKAELAAGKLDKAKLDKARTVLHQVLDDAKDRDLKAMAYNTLGTCAMAADQYQDARWDFLWVDVLYNQDKAEHARALYRLWKVFDHLNEGERARECLDMLLTDRQFAGTEYQRRAQREITAAQ